MPAGMSQVRQAIAARLSSIPDFTAYSFIPDAINAPAAWVEPDRTFIDYAKAFENGQFELSFLITVLVNRLDEPSAQEELDGYLDLWGPIVMTLQSKEIEDDLTELVSWVDVVSAARYGAYRIGNTAYLGAQMQVTVRA